MAVPENSAKGSWKGWVNVALVLMFTLGSLWLADLGFRAYERNFLLPVYPDPEGDAPVNLAVLSYNDGVVSRDTKPGEFRVLSFGDSFTQSIMEPGFSYNGILQQILDSELSDRSVSVVNLGEPGTGPNSFRKAHEFWSQVFQHQAVLFHIFLGNDVLDDAYLHSPLVWEPNIAVLQATNPFLEAYSHRVPSKFPLRMMDYAYAVWLTRKTTSAAELPPGYIWAALTELDMDSFTQTYFISMDNFNPARLSALLPGYQQIFLLLQTAQVIAASGIPVAVILGPSEPMVNDAMRASILTAYDASPDAYDLGLPARIIGMMQDRVAPDVPLLDLTQSFRVAYQETGEKLYFRRNTHWDQAGNRLAGERIADFLLQSWFDRQATGHERTDPSWPGPELLGRAELEDYLSPLFLASPEKLPEVTGAARVMQLFDGVIGDRNNWAMAELGQVVELRWPQPVHYSGLRIYLHDSDGRRYGFLLEAELESGWQPVADYRMSPVGGRVEINLPRQAISALRITGTSNSDQAVNPANTYIHIEELELLE